MNKISMENLIENLKKNDKITILSTDVGVASEILHENAIFFEKYKFETSIYFFVCFITFLFFS